MRRPTSTLSLALALLSVGCTVEVGDDSVLSEEEAKGCPSDGNSCTSDVKSRGKCLYEPLPDGSRFVVSLPIGPAE